MRRDKNWGRGGGSHGQGHGHGRQFNKLQSNNSPEIKFYPHGSGKQGQAVTYDAVIENIISYVQRTYRYGKDIAGSLRDLNKLDQ